MLLAVKDNEPPNPRGVGFFGPAAIVTKADRLAETIEQLWFWSFAGYWAGGSRGALI